MSVHALRFFILCRDATIREDSQHEEKEQQASNGVGLMSYFNKRRQKEKLEKDLLRQKRSMDINKHSKPVTSIDFVDLSQTVSDFILVS